MGTYKGGIRKMNKELEALIRIEDLLSRLDETDVINDDHLHDTNIIYEALKRLEELEKAFDTLSKENEKVMKELSKEIEKNRQLQIIEEELGIDLITLFKALTQGIYVKINREIDFIRYVSIFKKRKWHLYSSSTFWGKYDIGLIKNYGKTWALTKEELENGTK